MNSILCRATSVKPEQSDIHTDTLTPEDAYATMPVVAVQLWNQSLDEEVLHISFEEAISDRLTAIHGRLDRISNPLLRSQPVRRITSPIMHSDSAIQKIISTTIPEKRQHAFINAWQRCIIFSGLAMIFMMLGFDLMGLLMLLHIH